MRTTNLQGTIRTIVAACNAKSKADKISAKQTTIVCLLLARTNDQLISDWRLANNMDDGKLSGKQLKAARTAFRAAICTSVNDSALGTTKVLLTNAFAVIDGNAKVAKDWARGKYTVNLNAAMAIGKARKASKVTKKSVSRFAACDSLMDGKLVSTVKGYIVYMQQAVRAATGKRIAL